MLNLDTHILLHALAGGLRPKEQALLTTQPWGISTIVLWEICKLVEKGRISLDLDAPIVMQKLRQLHRWPIDLRIAKASTHLDFASDPADQIIAATSIVHGIPLVTRDRTIRRSKLVPFAH